jgi:hypothetical protein
MTAARTALAIAALVAGTAGCTEIKYHQQTAWQARLVPEIGLENPTATVAAVTRRATSIQAGITLQGDPNTVYAWEIGQGPCETASSTRRIGVLGSYPNLTTDANGDAEISQTFINGSLERGLAYYAAVVDPANRNEVLACGRLEGFSTEGNGVTG